MARFCVHKQTLCGLVHCRFSMLPFHRRVLPHVWRYGVLPLSTGTTAQSYVLFLLLTSRGTDLAIVYYFAPFLLLYLCLSCRNDKYPRHLLVDFRKLKPAPLRRYCELHDIPVRPDAPVSDVAVAVGRHFEVHLDVLDEDEVLARFLNAVRCRPRVCRSAFGLT